LDNNDKTTADGMEQAAPENTLDAGGDTSAPKLTTEEIARLLGDESAPPEMTAEEAAALAGEAQKGLHDIGEDQLEPPAPLDLDGEHIPGPDDNVVDFNSIPQKQDAMQESEKDKAPATEDKAKKTPGKPKDPEYEKALAKHKKELAEWESNRIKKLNKDERELLEKCNDIIIITEMSLFVKCIKRFLQR